MDGFFHGDPHPGNILGRPGSHQIVFLDLGLVGRRWTHGQRMDLLGLIYAIKEIDIPGIGDGLIALGKPTSTSSMTGLPLGHRPARPPVPHLRQGHVARLGARRLPRGPCSTTVCGLDSQLTLAMKAVIQAEETARALSFDIDLGEAAVTEARAALLESFTPDRIQKQVQGSALRIGKELARRAPSMEGAALSSGWTCSTAARSPWRWIPQGLERVDRQRQRHRPPGDGRRHRRRPAHRHGDRHGDPAPAGA